MKSPEFSSENNTEKIRSIEVKAEELLSLKMIREFCDLLQNQDYINEEYKQDENNSKIELLSNTPGISAIDKVWYQKREAEYQAHKETIDFKNWQLNKLTEFIEKQPIWKSKFSTSTLQMWHRADDEGRFEEYVRRLEESADQHKRVSFAGQNKDSIYYLSNSGVSLRLKRANLLGSTINAEKEGVLVRPVELPLFLDVKEPLMRNQNTDDKIWRFTKENVSFEPKVGYHVQEFCTSDFPDAVKSYTPGGPDFKSKIMIKEEGPDLVIHNADGDHIGHYINKVYWNKK